MINAAAADPPPSRRFSELIQQYQAASNLLQFTEKEQAIAVNASVPLTDIISTQVKQHIYAKTVYIYHNSTGMSEDEKKQIESKQISRDTIVEILENMGKRLRFTGVRDYVLTGGNFDLDQVLKIFIEKGNSPFNINFVKNFPFGLTVNEELYVLSLNPLKTINNPDGTSVVLEYVKTMLIEPLYEYDKDGVLKLKSFKFINFLDEDPSSVSHFKKKKASSKKKKASPKKKKASPKPKKKKASTKKKNHGGLS
jgi:hypothetical protein